jgi:ABC-type phosphate/phosphonate transport system substrate-binding protein
MITPLIRYIVCIVCAAAIVVALSGCSGTPEADAKWYLYDKPADMRVPVSGESDPGTLEPPIDQTVQ